MNAVTRGAIVAAVLGWYLFVRWSLTHALNDDEREHGLWTFAFWWPTFGAIPLTVLSLVLIFVAFFAVRWVVTGRGL